MVALNIQITDEQNKQVREFCKETGLKLAETVRRAIDDYLLQKRKEKFYNPVKNEEG